MLELVKVEKVNQSFLRRLNGKGIETVDDLWACVGEDVNTGIGQLAAQARIRPSLLVPLLIADSLGVLKESAKSPPARLWLSLKRLWQERSRYWLTIILILLPLLALALGARAALINLRTKLEPARTRLQLSAFRSNTPGDVADKKMNVGKPDDQDSTISSYQVSPTAQELLAADPFEELKERHVLSIPTKPGSFSSALLPPKRVWLLFSPRESGERASPPLIVKDVILLTIEHHGETVSIEVAVTEQELEKIKPLLGMSDIFIL